MKTIAKVIMALLFSALPLVAQSQQVSVGGHYADEHGFQVASRTAIASANTFWSRDGRYLRLCSRSEIECGDQDIFLPPIDGTISKGP